MTVAISTKNRSLPTAEGSANFTVTQLPATRALKAMARLGRVLGPALGALGSLRGNVGALASAAARADAGSDAAVSAIAEALGLVFEKLTDQEIDWIVSEFLSNATCNNALIFPNGVLNTAQLDSLFAGAPFAYLRLIAFALEVNYGDFFGVVGALGAKAQAQPSKSSE